MAHIIQLRQRIKTVAMIQKTTHAMRLTSMSTHARLLKKFTHLTEYRQELFRVIEHLKNDASHHVCAQAAQETSKTLTIVVGSQKGLCGSFNTRLFRYFEHHATQHKPEALIALGKKITENLECFSLLYSYNEFNASNFFAITNELCEHILGNQGYTDVVVISNFPQSFFIQKVVTTSIRVPRPAQDCLLTPINLEKTAYFYDQDPREILQYIEKIAMRCALEEVLFNSLIAEQAARFLSMDASTNNAQKLLESMRRDYNKLRQALITRELMDLTGGLL